MVSVINIFIHEFANKTNFVEKFMKCQYVEIEKRIFK